MMLQNKMRGQFYISNLIMWTPSYKFEFLCETFHVNAPNKITITITNSVGHCEKNKVSLQSRNSSNFSYISLLSVNFENLTV